MVLFVGELRCGIFRGWGALQYFYGIYIGASLMWSFGGKGAM